MEIAENQDLFLSRADIVVLAGGWGPADGGVGLSTALCQLATRGALILGVFVRGSADEAIAAGFAAEIGGRYSEYRWSEEGDAIAAFRSEMPANATPEPPDISLEPGEVAAKSPAIGGQVPRTCHRCNADNEATRRRCIRCHGLLDETERTTRT